MKAILRRIAVASLLILLATLFACASREPVSTAGLIPPDPTLIPIRQADASATLVKTPTPYVPAKKKPAAKKIKKAKPTRPAECPKCPECPPCPDQSPSKGATTTGDKTTASAADNPVLDALARELSLALDANKAVDQQSNPQSTPQPAPATPTLPPAKPAPPAQGQAVPAQPGPAQPAPVQPAPAQPAPAAQAPAQPAAAK